MAAADTSTQLDKSLLLEKRLEDDFDVGAVLGKYVVAAMHGMLRLPLRNFCRGAYSIVRLGVNKVTKQQVAVKFVNTKMFAKSGDCLRETMKEISALKQVCCQRVSSNHAESSPVRRSTRRHKAIRRC